jgi:mannose-6-phosphate isomerase-like protein (cupin superfamily)
MSAVDFDGLRIFGYTAGQSLDASVAVVEVAPGAPHAAAWSRRSDKYYRVSAGQIRFVLDGEPHFMRASFDLRAGANAVMGRASATISTS